MDFEQRGVILTLAEVWSLLQKLYKNRASTQVIVKSLVLLALYALRGGALYGRTREISVL